MDRYEQIIFDVLRKTEQENLLWKVVNPERYDSALLNTDRVIRAFTAGYIVGKREYTLLFVERKVVDTHDEFGYVTERYGFELFVLDEDGQIVLALYPGVVDRDDLLRLSGLIDEHNDRARAFFEAFDEHGVA